MSHPMDKILDPFHGFLDSTRRHIDELCVTCPVVTMAALIRHCPVTELYQGDFPLAPSPVDGGKAVVAIGAT